MPGRLPNRLRTTPAPLPFIPVTDAPGIGGTLKVHPGDFLVDEVPLYEPSGTGEHLYLNIQKEGVSHGEMIAVLARHFGVDRKAIGYAGMKDKHAVTRQMVSIHLHADPPSVAVPHERIQVLWADRHANKLRRGHLQGNRFSIRVRNVEPTAVPRAFRVLQALETSGIPAWYGEQRFGYRANNHIVGMHVLRRDWSAAADELLGTAGTPFPEYQRERREAWDGGDFSAAAAGWTRADRTELILTEAFARGAKPRDAFRRAGRDTMKFWTSAVASAVFNEVLARRISDGNWNTLIPGDLAWKHDSRAVFAVDDAELDDTLHGRLASGEVSPSGPVYGDGMAPANGDAAAYETAALDAFDLTPQLLTEGHLHPDGARRPLRDHISNVNADSGFDDHGAYIRCQFDLTRGMYATMVMREVMKPERSDPSDESA